MRPRINPACINPERQLWGSEIYSLQMDESVIYYHRVQAVLETRKIAVEKQIPIILLLNGVRFCRFEIDGKYRYIYDSKKDKWASPALKQLFIEKGIAVN